MNIPNDTPLEELIPICKKLVADANNLRPNDPAAYARMVLITQLNHAFSVYCRTLEELQLLKDEGAIAVRD